MMPLKAITVLILGVQLFQIVWSDDLPCQPRPQITTTKMGHSLYYDKEVDEVHIELYRCSGNVGLKHPDYYRCVADKSQIVSIHKVLKEYPDKKEAQFTFENHTKCVVKCVCNHPTHPCPHYDDLVLPTCPEGQKWDRDSCGCVNIKGKTGCNENGNDSSGGISVTMFVVSLMIEFVVVLIVIFLVMDVCKYRRHSKGIIYKTSLFVRQLSAPGGDGFKSTTLKREREATGSVSFLYDVNNGNLPNNNVANGRSV